eukprot:m51a1_g8455 hypothetical protein (648) ;mRNA; r:410422-414734
MPRVCWTAILALELVAAARAQYTPTLRHQRVYDFAGSSVGDALGSEWTGWANADGISLIGGSGPGLRVCQRGTGITMVSTELDPALWDPLPVRLSVSVTVAAHNVSVPLHEWNGLKFMVSRTLSGATTHDNPAVWGDVEQRQLSYTWTFYNSATAPSRIVVSLGLQESSGCAEFHDLNVTVVQLPTGWHWFSGVSTRLRGAMVAETVSAASLGVLGSWGANVVRFQLTDPLIRTRNTSRWWPIIRSSLDNWVDATRDTARAQGIKVLLDMHECPGNCTPGPERLCELQYNREMQEAFVELWERIAERYKGEYEWMWAFDLLNEPAFSNNIRHPGAILWAQLAERVARAVRAVDPQRPIVVSFDNWGGPYGAPELPVPVDKVLYTLHMYSPTCFTHQGVLSGVPVGAQYPSRMACDFNNTWDMAMIRKTLAAAKAFSETFKIQIIVGEFSAVRWAANNSAYRYIRDCIEVFEEHGWHWIYHAFREWNGWSVEYTENRTDMALARTPTERQKLLQSWLSRNSNPYTTNIVVWRGENERCAPGMGLVVVLESVISAIGRMGAGPCSPPTITQQVDIDCSAHDSLWRIGRAMAGTPLDGREKEACSRPRQHRSRWQHVSLLSPQPPPLFGEGSRLSQQASYYAGDADPLES